MFLHLVTFAVIDFDFRDIMNALKDIGEFVKATEFVGQTSGLHSWYFHLSLSLRTEDAFDLIF